MNVLLLSKYSAIGASSRLRFLQFIPYLEEHGIQVKVEALLDDEYLKKLYQFNQRSISDLAISYLKRLFSLRHINRYQLIWIEKEIFPMIPAILEVLLEKIKIPYIVDFDDPTFHTYDLHRSFFIRSLLSNKIKKVMKNASTVIVGNEYLAEYARNSGSNDVKIIPTVVDLKKYRVIREMNNNDIFTIGWIGSPSGFKHLKELSPVFEKFFKKTNGRLQVVSSGNFELPNISVKNIEWNQSNEVEEVNQFDVGIMPLENSPWEKGKCGFKLVQYMACGIPVIASPVGSNMTLVKNKKNGFLAETFEDWYDAFSFLAKNKIVATQMGIEGRTLVEKEYSIQANLPNLVNILKKYQ